MNHLLKKITEMSTKNLAIWLTLVSLAVLIISSILYKNQDNQTQIAPQEIYDTQNSVPYQPDVPEGYYPAETFRMKAPQ